MTPKPRLLSVILAALLLGLIPSTALAQQIGFVAQVEGDVALQPAGTSVWLPVAQDDVVNLGDTISTGLDSSAKILLADETVISLGEETVLFVDRFVVGDLATVERSILLRLQDRAGEDRAPRRLLLCARSRSPRDAGGLG